jgi:hypothetical protein
MRFTTLAFSAVVLAIPFAAANAQPAPAGYQQSPGEGGMRHFLTPEQRMMWHEQLAPQIASMTGAQRHAYYQQQMQQIMAMPAEQQAGFRNDLQARWNALPPQQKQAYEQRIAQHHARMLQMRQGGAQPGHGPQSGDNEE